VAQVIGLLGWVAGLWLTFWVAHALSVHWHAANPAVMYRVLRWIVAVLAGLTVVSLLQWVAESLGRATRSGPLGMIDRGAGFLTGVVLGTITAALVLMASLVGPVPRGISQSAADAFVTEPLMATGFQAGERSSTWMPGGAWLTREFRKAHRRMLALRAGDAKTKS